LKSLAKRTVRWVFLIAALPGALLAGFGRFGAGFTFFAQACALVPGLPGDYLRAAFYRLTLRGCTQDVRICFGTLFAHRDAVVGKGAYIGAYCVIGRAQIGERVQIASHVQILSGSRQHARDTDGNILGAEQGVFQEVSIGEGSWIGAGAIVMADVGARSTVGAGSVVTKAVPDGVIAAGNPARVMRVLEPAS
jgi:virginiamycin A acetyltransferase